VAFFPPPLARPFIFASYGGRAEAHGAKAGRPDDDGSRSEISIRREDGRTEILRDERRDEAPRGHALR
jgi:hypothetical protein